MQYSFSKRMKRIFKYREIQNISFTPHKELNIFIYWAPSYLTIYRSHIHFLKWSGFYWPTLGGVATWGIIGIYTHPKSVHLKYLWGIFSSSCEAEHQQATASWRCVNLRLKLLAVEDPAAWYCSGTMAEPAGEEGFIALHGGRDRTAVCLCHHWLSLAHQSWNVGCIIPL